MAEELIRLNASPSRRILGVSMLGALGALMIYLALTQVNGPVAVILFIGLGSSALWAALRMWEVTKGALILTQTELRSSEGKVLTQITDVTRVDRGILAMKPSAGFSLSTGMKHPLAWAPGLYWQWGRRIGVGGVTSAAHARMMADMISGMILKDPPAGRF